MSNVSAAYDAAPVQKIDAGDATLAYRRFGSGPSLLLIHGFPLHGFTWRHLLPLLAPRFTCHVVDSAGKGDSTWRAETDFEFTGHARRLKTIADRLGLERYGVVAQDTGATVARCLALADPQRVERLVLINTEIPGHRPPWIVPYQYLMRLPGSRLMFRQLMRSRAFLRSGMGFGGCFSDLDLIDGDFHARFVAPYVSSAEKTAGMARYLVGLHWNIVDALAQRHAELRMPVLLVWGEDDPTFPIDRARGMIPQFADCRGLTPVAGTKLLPHEEKPAVVAEIVREFCSRA
jgi:pimeloyl-ACP methyl ester carboxylesterase